MYITGFLLLIIITQSNCIGMDCSRKLNYNYNRFIVCWAGFIRVCQRQAPQQGCDCCCYLIITHDWSGRWRLEAVGHDIGWLRSVNRLPMSTSSNDWCKPGRIRAPRSVGRSGLQGCRMKQPSATEVTSCHGKSTARQWHIMGTTCSLRKDVLVY